MRQPSPTATDNGPGPKKWAPAPLLRLQPLKRPQDAIERRIAAGAGAAATTQGLARTAAGTGRRHLRNVPPALSHRSPPCQRKPSAWWRITLACCILTAALAGAQLQAAPDLSKLRLPEGFAIRTLTAEAENARQLALAADGTLYVGTRRAGLVYAIPDALTAAAPEVIIIARGLTMPSGLAMRGEDLYVAALNQVLRFADIGGQIAAGAQPASYEVITDSLPDRRHHGWKYIKFGPDGQLYVPVGAPCNICLSEDLRHAALLRMDPDTGETDIIAQGIRNTVGFAWHPATGELWFTDNGRDLMGDDLPPEEVNVLAQDGQHFGYPFRHGPDLADPDPQFTPPPEAQFVPPVVNIQAHSAALGVDFQTSRHFPPLYQGALFIAEHGSWNRSAKVGYQVSVITFPDGRPQYAPFITGWLEGERNWGRPTDVLAAPDGSLLISDDQQGAIYQVTWSGAATAQFEPNPP